MEEKLILREKGYIISRIYKTYDSNLLDICKIDKDIRACIIQIIDSMTKISESIPKKFYIISDDVVNFRDYIVVYDYERELSRRYLPKITIIVNRETESYEFKIFYEKIYIFKMSFYTRKGRLNIRNTSDDSYKINKISINILFILRKCFESMNKY